jgi:ubiquinone/menaquinone biosynthesis C-methylase UbiE
MIYDKHQATAEFNRWSESYDRSVLQWLLFGPSHRAMIRRIKSEFGERPVRVLDVGCGTGLFASRIRQALPGSQVVGVDLVPGMLAKGSERWKRMAGEVFPVQADSERLPFGWGTFDVVTCANSFHHYPNQGRAVEEMRRVLKPGGRLILVDGYRDRPYGWLIYDVCVAGIEGAVHHASARRVRELFEAAGFGGVTQKVHPGFAPYLLSEGVAPDLARSIPAPHFSEGRLNRQDAKDAEERREKIIED